MGMVRQWQELLHGGRYSHSYTAALPDFVKLAEAYQAVGIRAEKPSELDDVIREHLADGVIKLGWLLSPDAHRLISLGELHEIRQSRSVGMRIAAAMQQLLPLAHHAH